MTRGKMRSDGANNQLDGAPQTVEFWLVCPHMDRIAPPPPPPHPLASRTFNSKPQVASKRNSRRISSVKSAEISTNQDRSPTLGPAAGCIHLRLHLTLSPRLLPLSWQPADCRRSTSQRFHAASFRRPMSQRQRQQQLHFS
jgi:hypothetical protein